MGLLQEFAQMRHRISVGAYHQMAEEGILSPQDRVELIDGEIIDGAPIGKLHASVVDRLARGLFAGVVERAIVRVQGPLRLSEDSEPEPDFSLLKPRRDFYRDAPPTAADVLLVIEVSDSTQRYDRRIKVPLYARHDVPEVWVIDLENSLVHLHRNPGGGTYADISSTQRPGSMSIAMLPGVEIGLSGAL